VAASTQNQALSALLLLYRDVLDQQFGWLDDVVRAKKPKRLPVVFSPEKAIGVIGQLRGVRWIMAMQLYGGGLRLNECLRQRVKDLDFQRLQVTVRDGKGEKDRVTLLPEEVVDSLKEHLIRVRSEHERASREGYGGVELPYALERKYPQADRQWGWQYVFPAARPSIDQTPASFECLLPTEGSSRCDREVGDPQACRLSHFSPFIRYPTAGRWHRHPHGPGAIGPQGCANYADLYSRSESERLCGQEPCGQVLACRDRTS